jgi:hypothetical protein
MKTYIITHQHINALEGRHICGLKEDFKLGKLLFACENVCYPVVYGELGLHNLKLLNNAFRLNGIG